MPLYEGETLKEAIQKAVRGKEFDTGTLTGGYPLPDAADCTWLANTLQKMDGALSNLEQDLRDLEMRFKSLRDDQRKQLLIAGLEVAALAVPLTRILRARRIIRAAMVAVRRGLRENPFLTIIVLLGEASGALGVASRLNRAWNDQLEIAQVLQSFHQTRAAINQLESQTRDWARKLDASNCSFRVQNPIS